MSTNASENRERHVAGHTVSVKVGHEFRVVNLNSGQSSRWEREDYMAVADSSGSTLESISDATGRYWRQHVRQQLREEGFEWISSSQRKNVLKVVEAITALHSLRDFTEMWLSAGSDLQDNDVPVLRIAVNRKEVGLERYNIVIHREQAYVFKMFPKRISFGIVPISRLRELLGSLFSRA